MLASAFKWTLVDFELEFFKRLNSKWWWRDDFMLVIQIDIIAWMFNATFKMLESHVLITKDHTILKQKYDLSPCGN